jgi:sec-independent protein translocase protein TatB
MLPEIGATELLVIAVVALIVVGPKDLPILLRKLGQWMAKARGMANEFRASFDEMARQSELDELRREVQALRTGQLSDPFHAAAGDASQVAAEQVFADIDAGLRGGEANLSPAVSWTPESPPEPVAAPVAEAEAPKRKRAPARPKAVAALDEPAPAAKPRAPRKKKTGTPS